jgi:hypothetical protein
MQGDNWVDTRLALLCDESVREGDAERGLTILRIRARRKDRRRRWTAAALATGACLVVLLGTTRGRPLAQQLWQTWLLRGVTVVRVNFDDLNVQSLQPQEVSGRVTHDAVGDLRQATALAGFAPTLPTAAGLPGTPRLSVISSMRFQLRLDAAELRSALSQAGATDIQIPDVWNGTSVGIDVGPIVEADYPEIDASLLQARPFTLVTPQDVDPSKLVEIAFRLLRLSPGDARRLAHVFAATPSLFLGIPADERASIEVISLHSGPGVYVEEYDDNTGQLQRTTVVWATSDRISALSSTLPRGAALAAVETIR